jgi:hypothetical protein
MSRIELPPSARPFVPERDLLVGGPSDQRRHLLARTALLRHLLVEPRVQQAFEDWATHQGFREPLQTLTTRLDTIAADAGLSSRTALFAPESTLDASTETAGHEAVEAFWSGVTGNSLELTRDGRRLAEPLVTALRLSEVCIPWLTWELLSWFCDGLRAQIENRPVARRYTEGSFRELVTVQIDPRMSARQRSRAIQQQVATQLAAARAQSTVRRMPNRDGQNIATYVESLIKNRLHGVSMMALARALLRSEPDVPRSPNYDAHRRVQYGIAQARTWLARVAPAPSPQSAQP